MATETVLITGASFGIGKELARCFAADKSDLILVARSMPELEELARELRTGHDIKVWVYRLDLAEPNAARKLFDWCEQEGITVDVLVNNAGFGLMLPMWQMPEQPAMDMVQVNVAALTQLTQLFLPGIREREKGGILNVASTAAYQAGPNMGIYYATKAYVLHFTEAIAEELRSHDVNVSCLCPGPTVTEFAKRAEMEKSAIFRMGPMDAQSVARIGHAGFRKGRTIVIPGWKNFMGAFAVRFAPRFLLRRIIRSLNVNKE